MAHFLKIRHLFAVYFVLNVFVTIYFYLIVIMLSYYMVLTITPNPREVLKHANDVMENELRENAAILMVVSHDKDDPTKFTIVADSNYTTGLEGVKLTFADPQDFKKHFPELIPVEFRKDDDTMRIKETDINDYKYMPIMVKSYPPVDPSNITFAASNVLDKEYDTNWAVKKMGARFWMDYGKDIEMKAIWIAWPGGDKRQFKFTIAYATDEGYQQKKVPVIPHLKDVYSSGKTYKMESYNMVENPKDKPIVARYVIIQINGNTLKGNEEWAGISRVEVTKNAAVKSMQTSKLIY